MRRQEGAQRGQGLVGERGNDVPPRVHQHPRLGKQVRQLQGPLRRDTPKSALTHWFQLQIHEGIGSRVLHGQAHATKHTPFKVLSLQASTVKSTHKLCAMCT